MLDQLKEIGQKTLHQIDQAVTVEDLEKIRVSVLGKKGSFSEILRGLGKLPPDQRKSVGQAANEWKTKVSEKIQEQNEKLQFKKLQEKIKKESVDITLPGRKFSDGGSLHPITQVMHRVIGVFEKLGFDVTTGPEVETEYLTFDAINIPQNHPARDMQDTFFLGPGVVLRTHTSPVQMRTMRSRPWPIRILSPGAVYRCDNDATHSPMFHQVEGLWIDRSVRMSDLKGVLDFFAKEIFGSEAKIRLRPSYFPFVEPGAEVDVDCGRGWLEILGAGMVHPKLFEEAGYSRDEVSGFAFGIGIERIAMLLYGVDHIRRFYQGDLQFLKQFPS